ncbi:GTP cyclohydrolase I FolE2 [Dyella solisilvae]|uniref:GTP cyclohydrolase FolE2 n=1 Tax=Dyella solisilvae TaxID=1920168 RepID=A0A370K5S0_9GAMM|nr:GTP cyclohydrolase FolE2 [Dyella solisilvae]RDI97989.1 GTP cyclohydrolase I FolE2 [Dyella solisilvae]
MKGREQPVHPLPDVAIGPVVHPHDDLDWVGMEGIALPVSLDAGDGERQRVIAKVDAFVNLARARHRGIHMSRLYLLLDEHLGGKNIDPPTLLGLLQAFVQSHAGLADRARLRIRFEFPVRRAALRSGHHGWRCYPVEIEATLGPAEFTLELGAEVVYSSTCPASAALSRQLIQQQFARDFPADRPLDRATIMTWLGDEQGILATPHAQRSTAHLRVRLAEGAALHLLNLIDSAEQALGTPVQAAVKREDEQAFALANGRNLMFCEDAARRLRRVLDAMQGVASYRIRVAHHESLHAHDAVAFASGDCAVR